MTPPDVTLRIVCGWCQRVLQAGSPAAPISHGMCPACSERFEAAAHG